MNNTHVYYWLYIIYIEYKYSYYVFTVNIRPQKLLTKSYNAKVEEHNTVCMLRVFSNTLILCIFNSATYFVYNRVAHF